MAQQDRFLALVEGHEKIVYKICRSYCKNPSDRDDLAQEIVVALWRSFGSFDERSAFSTWMYRVALNVAISFYRRDHRRTKPLTTLDEPFVEQRAAVEREPEDILALREFLEELDPLNKALVLLYLDGNRYREIAEILGITETNVATKLSRLKSSMKSHLSYRSMADERG